MIYRELNMAGIDPVEFCENNAIFIDCNIEQVVVDTKVCVGKTGLTFRRCNLWQAGVPADAIVEDCGGYRNDGTQVQWDKCYWKHLADSSDPLALPVEPVNCRHVDDELNVDGKSMLIRTDKLKEGV